MENLLKKFNWIAHSSNVFYSNEKIFVFNKEMQNYLIDLISKSECEIARICAHNNHKDRLHEMVIVLKDSHYVAPHKHINKSESFHIIEGILGSIMGEEFICYADINFDGLLTINDILLLINIILN